MEAVTDGAIVELAYALSVEGEAVESTEGREPLTYVHGQGQLIPGLEKRLAGLHEGDHADVTVGPEEGYGLVDPKAFIEMPKTQLPDGVTPALGLTLRGTDEQGQPFRARIFAIGETTVTLDFNHPLAGKTLQFSVTVLKVSPTL